jgi:2-polyprenyl-3-methyl-5-hydroxy-6-metoxy-1,4-benzoquinol methylase
MDKFNLATRIKNSRTINKELFIQEKCRGKNVLDLGCIRHNADFALKDLNWLHMKIKSVANKIIGIDYLPVEIEKLQNYGYDIVFGDVTKPLDINEKFDVIVAGDIIEHLTNFEGFFENCSRLLNPEGILIVTTPNPYYAGEFHFVAFKNNFLINPEHTCWICPQALSQLSDRFSYIIDEIYFIKNSWELKGVICETKKHEYDILNGVWLNETFGFKVFKKITGIVFGIVYKPYRILTGSNSKLVRHSY